MPQLFMLSRTGSAETITAHYLFALGRNSLKISKKNFFQGVIEAFTFSIGSTDIIWVFLNLKNFQKNFFRTENHFYEIALVAGVAQTVHYADFIYLYVTRVVLQEYVFLYF